MLEEVETRAEEIKNQILKALANVRYPGDKHIAYHQVRRITVSLVHAALMEAGSQT